MSLLEVRDLSIRYGATDVVSGLDFDVAPGEAVGLVGASGSGKSQTALAIMGLLPRAASISGSVRLGPHELLGAPARVLDRVRPTRIAMVFQDPAQALNPYLRVGRQLVRILEQHRIARGASARQKVVEMLARVGLPDAPRQAAAWPHELSGGMRQRVMIASALLAGPELLVADEPTTALDVTVQAQILDLLETLRRDTALLLITHDLGIVAGRCERMLVLEAGRLVESGPVREVFSRPQAAGTEALLAATPAPGAAREAVAGPEVFRIEGAAVCYRPRRGPPLHAVRGVGLAVARGEIVAVVGESGAGKTSLGRAALGLVPLAAGRIVLAGSELAPLAADRSLAARRAVQLVFQDPAASLNPRLTVSDIVAEPLTVHEPGLKAAERGSRVEAALAATGLEAGFMTRYPHELSGGQAQRVAIARALILEPRVLICDEAVAALDGRARRRILGLFDTARAETGLAVIFITHDLGVAQEIAHRVLVMYLGRLAELGPAAAVLSQPRHPYTQALLAAVPRADPRDPGGRATITGEVPSPVATPAGCAFHPRCPRAEGRCAEERPAARGVAGSRVACHFAEEFLAGDAPA